ncbi:MAG: aminotransferase class V-fold PLP-dependent enzyme [Rhodospirillales bacterium]|nr:aminotransferase class V-fold PLP-dependent enzyme [Rhodospirillales bacterium]
MLASQRDLFDIPREVCYLNAAAWGPLPREAVEAGRIGVARKAQPWRIDADFATAQYARARAAAGALIGAAAEDIAIIPSVGYGISTAAKALALGRGSRVLVLAEDHSSPVLEWHARAASDGILVEALPRPPDGDWTGAVLGAISDAAPFAALSISTVHWSDSGCVDPARIAPALRDAGGALILDATHAAGVTPIDVAAIDPDFLVFPTYKWTLGPYGRAFLYVAKRRQDAVPLEQTAYGRRGVAAEQTIYLADLRYRDGAARFDMGERDHFVSLEMAAIGMELVASWGAASLAERLGALTARLARGVAERDVTFLPASLRAPQILSLGFPRGLPAALPGRLAAAGVHVAARLGRLRISPHAYNDEADIDRFLDVFRDAMR